LNQAYDPFCEWLVAILAAHSTHHFMTMTTNTIYQHKNAAQLVGALFLTATATYLVGSSLLEPILTSKNVLQAVANSSSTVVLGMLLELICGVAVVGTAVVILPVFKQHHYEKSAYWYLGFRLVEVTTIMLGGIALLALVAVSKDFVAAGNSADPWYAQMGKLLTTIHYWSYQMLLFTYIGGLAFYYALYQTQLLPRFISVWGFVGYVLLLIGVVLEFFGYQYGVMFAIVGGLNEIFMGIWLIVKGFKQTHLTN
jgi:hypothetical protein